MPHRFALLNSLTSMAKGNLLAEASDSSSSGILLLGAPDACHVFELMRQHGWIEPAGRQGKVTWWRISPAGRAAYEEGRQWLRSLSWMQRLLGRFGLVALPPAPPTPPTEPEGVSASKPL